MEIATNPIAESVFALEAESAMIWLSLSFFNMIKWDKKRKLGVYKDRLRRALEDEEDVIYMKVRQWRAKNDIIKNCCKLTVDNKHYFPFISVFNLDRGCMQVVFSILLGNL